MQEQNKRISALCEYKHHLKNQERSENTIVKYTRDISTFLFWLENRALTKTETMEYKHDLLEHYCPASANSMIIAINGFLEYIDRQDCTVKTVRIQKKICCEKEKELSKKDYSRLIEAAKHQNNARLVNIMRTICATGIRISELCYITVEAVKSGKAVVTCKGKIRTIFISRDLQRVLNVYIQEQKLIGGSVFITRSGRPVDRSNVWSDMKKLCRSAGVNPEKVFPHNLRHLFARTFYAIEKDISRLADILGHSSIETTRIYILDSGYDHERQLSKLQLVV